VPFERDLIAGIAGQLRNQVSLFRASRDTSTQYNPLIESVTDSYGREAFREHARTWPATVRVDVGDVLELRGRAFNSRDTEVNWMLVFSHMLSPHIFVTPSALATGDDVNFRYEVSEADVGESMFAVVYIATDARFHRHQRTTPPHDDAVFLNFTVNPPLG